MVEVLAEEVKELERNEGFKQFPYHDTVGKLTIGYGFNLESDGLTKEESECVLKIRLNRRLEELVKVLPWVGKLDPPRQGVLLDMAYNLGIAGLLAFKNTLALVKAGEFKQAAHEMLQSKWAKQVGERANRLSRQMELGVWQ